MAFLYLLDIVKNIMTRCQVIHFTHTRQSHFFHTYNAIFFSRVCICVTNTILRSLFLSLSLSPMTTTCQDRKGNERIYLTMITRLFIPNTMRKKTFPKTGYSIPNKNVEIHFLAIIFCYRFL